MMTVIHYMHFSPEKKNINMEDTDANLEYKMRMSVLTSLLVMENSKQFKELKIHEGVEWKTKNTTL